MADPNYAWNAESAALEKIRGEITKEVAPQIRSFQETVAAVRAYEDAHPSSKPLPGLVAAQIAAENALLNATAEALKERGFKDTQRTDELPKTKDSTPATSFEASVVFAAVDGVHRNTVPLNTPTGPRAPQGKAK